MICILHTIDLYVVFFAQGLKKKQTRALAEARPEPQDAAQEMVSLFSSFDRVHCFSALAPGSSTVTVRCPVISAELNDIEIPIGKHGQ